jgi:ribosomal protein S18
VNYTGVILNQRQVWLRPAQKPFTAQTTLNKYVSEAGVLLPAGITGKRTIHPKQWQTNIRSCPIISDDFYTGYD